VITIIVAVYLYRQFHEYKRRHGPGVMEYPLQGETEFEIAPSPRSGTKTEERSALVGRTSGDDLFFDEEDEIGR
jgi:hypothetical protein